jgi:hypothetical protein
MLTGDYTHNSFKQCHAAFALSNKPSMYIDCARYAGGSEHSGGDRETSHFSLGTVGVAPKT